MLGSGRSEGNQDQSHINKPVYLSELLQKLAVPTPSDALLFSPYICVFVLYRPPQPGGGGVSFSEMKPDKVFYVWEEIDPADRRINSTICSRAYRSLLSYDAVRWREGS